MEKTLNRLLVIFREMVANYKERGAIWKNIPLGKEAFELMKSLPPTVKGEFNTPADKAHLLSQMLDHMDEETTPRFAIGVREYMHSLDPKDEDNNRELKKLRDYIDLDFPMPEYCKRYRRHLKFDPIERTEQWEEVIYDVEKECDKRLKGMPRGMGFCFAHWSAKRDVLSEYGIDWNPPTRMNPGVMFD